MSALNRHPLTALILQIGVECFVESQCHVFKLFLKRGSAHAVHLYFSVGCFALFIIVGKGG